MMPVPATLKRKTTDDLPCSSERPSRRVAVESRARLGCSQPLEGPWSPTQLKQYYATTAEIAYMSLR